MEPRKEVSEKISNEKYKLAHSETLGRYFVAAKDLTPGEVILRENVKAVGPGTFNDKFMCFACLTIIEDVENAKKLCCCQSCNVAIFCSPACQNEKTHHTKDECDAFRSNESLSELDKLPTILQILLPLRIWLLQKGDEELWKRVLSMEAHVEERRGTPIWMNREVNVNQVLRTMGLVPEEPNCEPELLQRLCGILDVNSFELRPPGGLEDSPLRGLYPDTAIMAHECTRNTHITVDDKFQITVYAAMPIKAGQSLLVNYTSPLLGSEERRDHLRQGKYFECVCARCSDPTELGSNLSTFICPRCKTGFVTNKNPLSKDVYADKVSWQCDKCGSLLSGKLVKTTLVLTKSLIEEAETNMQSLEDLLKKLLCSYHPNHFFVISVKQKLYGLYKRACICLNPERKYLESMLKIGNEIIDVLEIVEPGISRPKGILLWEMHLPMVLVADLDYTDKKIGAGKLVERMEEAQKVLKRSLTMLLLEPPETPEGFAARQALQDFKSLRETLVQARLLESSLNVYNSRRDVNKKKIKIE